MKKLNTVISSRINRSLVLALIHRNPMISRAQLADMTELDRSAITQILNYLLGEKLVYEAEKGKSGKKGGRAPIHLSIEYNARNMIIVEVSMRRIVGLITNLAGKELVRTEITIQRGDPLLEKLLIVLDRLKEENPKHFDRAVLITVGTPGVVDRDSGIVILNWLHGWRDVHLADEISQQYGKPAFIENDANASAVGELSRLEKEMACRSLVYLFLRDSYGSIPLGVGGALILDGKLSKGAHCFSGESADTINAFFRRVVEKHDTNAPADGHNLSSLIRRADEGDAGAQKSIRLIASRLGDMLAEIATFVDPDAVMVSVDPPDATLEFWKLIEKEYLQQISPMTERDIPIVASIAGKNAALEGLVALSLEKVFVKDTSRVSLLVG